MYEYEFVRLKADRLGLGGFRVDDDAYREVIHTKAREGWRLVQVFAPSLTGYGRPKFYDIIERRVSDGNSRRDR